MKYIKNIQYNFNRTITEPVLLFSDIYDCSKNYCIDIDRNGQYIKQYYTVSKNGIWKKSEIAPYMPSTIRQTPQLNNPSDSQLP